MYLNSGSIVHVDAYGSGERPVFDGNINDFSTAPDAGTEEYAHWYAMWYFNADNSSMKNIEIKNVYGNAIILKEVDNFILHNCIIHNFGTSGIGNNYNFEVHNNLVEENIFYYGQQLCRYGKVSGWGAAINFASHSFTNNNIVRKNIVYDIYGEGINNPNGITEYNILGDTGSIALNTAAHDFDQLTSVVRYNLVLMSNWDISIYDSLSGSGPVGIRVFDEVHSGTDECDNYGGDCGDNSNADIQIYGNVVINRERGIWVFKGDNMGPVDIHHNIFIDSQIENFALSYPEEFNSVQIYNNSFVRYDTTGNHIGYGDPLPHENWLIKNNLFYTKNEDPPSIGMSGWDDGLIVSDPLLPGETPTDIINWVGFSGPDYYKQINFTKHLYPPAGSPLNQIGITEDYLRNICENLPIDLGCEGTSSQLPQQKLIAHYTMDSSDISEGQVLDSSGNEIHATMYGNPQTSSGRIFESLHFDGVDDYLDTGYADDINQWTVSVWVKGDSNPKSDRDAGPVMKQENFLMSWDHRSNPFRQAAGLSVGGTWYPSSFGTLVGGTWYHIVATYDEETLRTYRDGQLITSNAQPSGSPDSAVESMKIARHAVNDYLFAGYVDDVRIYNYALSASEVSDLYNLGEVSVCGFSDSNSDGIVTISELIDYISQWKIGNVSISNLIDAIGKWKSGC
jgi:hypothetical protein